MSTGRIALWAAGAVGTLAIIAVALVFMLFPRVSPATDLKIEATPERIAYGSYLFNHRMACTACHTPEMEPHRFSRVPDETRIGAGRHMGGPPGFPAEIYAPNLTPAALSGWTDGEIYRAIAAGVARDGRALFPLMPYPSYRSLDPEDAKALIAYMRTLPPQPVTLPPTELPMPLPIFMRFVPSDPAPEPKPDTKDELALGKYLATTSSCFECHTKRNDRGEPVGIPFAGGNAFGLPGGGIAVSANITPDVQTGIGGWSREQFVARFHAMTLDVAAKMTPGRGDADTEMPWTAFSGMTDEDLGAIYAYLRSLPAIHSAVTPFEPPAK